MHKFFIGTGPGFRFRRISGNNFYLRLNLFGGEFLGGESRPDPPLAAATAAAAAAAAAADWWWRR